MIVLSSITRVVGDVIKLKFKKENFNNFYEMLKETDWFGLVNTEYDLFGNLVCYTDVNKLHSIVQFSFYC